MKITVHRGMDQIGGNVIEISTDKTKILLDAGLELETLEYKEVIKTEDVAETELDLEKLLSENDFSAIFREKHGNELPTAKQRGSSFRNCRLTWRHSRRNTVPSSVS